MRGQPHFIPLALLVLSSVEHLIYFTQMHVRVGQKGTANMTARPSSPTSMLWAHQLKREHGYLVKRMQDLETSSDRQNMRIKTAETAAKSGSNVDVATLAKQIKALEEGGVTNRLARLENEMKLKTEELEAGSEAITAQVAAMQKDTEAVDEDKRKAFSKDKALLKRIGELETGLKTYEQYMVQLGRRVDASRLEQISAQLEGLSKQVAREGSQVKTLTESFTALEVANEELKRSNQHMTRELEKLAARPVAAVATPQAEKKDDDVDAGADDEQQEQDLTATSIDLTAPPKTKKRKGHKWAGGSADRDIVKAGAQMFGDTMVMTSDNRPDDPQQHEESEDEAPVPKKRRLPPKPKQKIKPIPPHLRPPPSSDQPKAKSHKWSGGGADRDIIRGAQGDNTRSSRQGDIVRRGRGWIEVEVSQGAEKDSTG